MSGVDAETQSEIVQAIVDRLHLLTPDPEAKAAALMSTAISLLVDKHGESGLDIAVGITQAGIVAAAETLNLTRRH